MGEFLKNQEKKRKQEIIRENAILVYEDAVAYRLERT